MAGSQTPADDSSRTSTTSSQRLARDLHADADLKVFKQPCSPARSVVASSALPPVPSRR